MGFTNDIVITENMNASSDEMVIFEPSTHTYYYKRQPLLSVTQFIKEFTPPFDPLYPSINKAKSNVKTKTGIKDPKKLRKYWRLKAERATHLGTSVHTFAEMYMMDEKNTKPKHGYEEAIISVIDWFAKQGWEIISQEDILYNVDWMLAGSADLILYNKERNEYAIGDWKITEDMYKGYGKLLAPFASFKNIALNKYSIQADIYSLMSPYRIMEYNRYVIQLKHDGTFDIYHPKHEDEKFRLPFTMDKTKKSINMRKKLYKPLNK